MARVPDDTFQRLIARAAQRAPALAPHIDRLGPIEVTRSPHPTVVDQLFMEIVNQQLSAKAADAIWARIEAAAAERGLQPRALFTAEHEAVVRACGLSANKTRALREVRAAEAAGQLDQAELAAMAAEERAARLTSIWGVGRWTADMISIFHFLEPDVWPVGDVAVLGTLRRVLDTQDIAAVAAAFAPHRSLLARYLWRIRDGLAVQNGGAGG